MRRKKSTHVCPCGNGIAMSRSGVLHDRCSRCRRGTLPAAQRISRPEAPPRVVASLRLTSAEVDASARLRLPVLRPQTRAECPTERPCPWAGCRHHLALDVTPAGSLLVYRPDADVAEIAESCSLDVADRGGLSLEDIGEMMNVTRERIRQIEAKAMKRFGAMSKELA